MESIAPEPVFRIRQRGRSGSQLFIYGIRMNSVGPIHFFANHNHARNFCRYLFSKSSAHQPNHLTGRNVVCEYEDAEPRGRALRDPDAALADFMARRFPRRDADRLLCDDGAYAAFALLTAEGDLVSNVVAPDGNTALIDVSHMASIHAEQGDVTEIEDLVRKARRVIDFEGEREPSELSLLTDMIVQRLVSSRMGFEPLLTVSHRDQLDHNQCYHIHRLIRMPQPAGPQPDMV